MNKTEVLIQLPTETSYWGSDATKADVSRICDNLESMIRAEFEARLELTFERTQTRAGAVFIPTTVMPSN
jgi:hypothetical protein